MYNILLVGVGGQGVLTMFKILGNAAQLQNLQVNGAETHGMSQRGGSVYVHLRFNDEPVFSPLIMEGEADLLVSLEPVETLRFAPFVKKNGVIITSKNPVDPPNLPLTKKKYPDVEKIVEKLQDYTPNIIAIDYKLVLGELGLRSLNIAALGTMSNLHDFPITKENLAREIKSKLKRFWEEANQAFELGFSNSNNENFIQVQ